MKNIDYRTFIKLDKTLKSDKVNQNLDPYMSHISLKRARMITDAIRSSRTSSYEMRRSAPRQVAN